MSREVESEVTHATAVGDGDATVASDGGGTAAGDGDATAVVDGERTVDADATGDDGERTPEAAPGDDGAGPRGKRDIAVPLRLYKTVTVFSTLIAVVSVVAGFVLLDAATLQFSVLRRLLVAALGALGVAPAGDVLSALLAIAGLLVIGLGAGVYVVGARFRPADMGKSQEDSGVE